MDNSLIYGEWLGLTGLLYQFWTIMRSIANFVIVFLLVWTIGKQMRDWAKWAKELGKTILAIMVSGIVINASWFLIGALVDLSTIATYGVWTVPLKLQWWDENYCKTTNDITTVENPVTKMNDIAKLWTCRPILATHGTMNLSDTFNAEAAQWKVYYSYEATKVNPWTHYFLSCPFKNGTLATDEWTKFLKSFTSSSIYTLKNWTTGTIAGDQKVKDYLLKSDSIGRKYCVVWTNQIMEVPANGNTDLYGSWYYEAVIWWVNMLHSWWWLRIRNLVETNKGMIGVMYTMYGNMLWFANIKTDVQTNSTESQIIQFLVKWFFGFAIMFPLIALCVVLMMRVAVLWMVVWFSPLLVLWWTLKLMKIENKQLDSMMDWIGKNLTLSNVINLLFQPVLVVFVISMGMMFLDALQATIVADNGFWEALKCDNIAGQQCCSMVDVVNICFVKFNAQAGTDAFFNYFSFTIVNIVGVMLLWFMVFAVMKSSKITEWAVSKIQWFGRNVLWSIPVVPWFDGSFVWFDGAKEGLGKVFDTVTEGTEDTSGKTVTQPYIDKISDQLTGKVWSARKDVSSAWDNIEIKDIENWTKTAEFGKELIKKIWEQSKNVKYATANELLDASDDKIKKLLNKYDASDALSLFSNPRFLSDTGQTAKGLTDSFAVWDTKRRDYGISRSKYLKSLESKIKSLDVASGTYENGSLAVVSWDKKKLFESIITRKDWVTTDIKFEPLSWWFEIAKSWNYSYDDISSLNEKIKFETFKKYVGWTSQSPFWDKAWWKAIQKEWTDLVSLTKDEAPKSAAATNAWWNN